jgi:hypothetical protein
MGSQERWPAFQAPTANTPQLGRHHESAERSCNKRSDSNGAPNILSNAPATSPSFREGMPAAHNNSCSHLTILCCASASSQPCTRPALVDSISAIHLFCTLLSNLSPCTAPSTAKTLCDSSIRRPLPTTIPANSNQSINPYGTYHTPRPATPFLNPCTCVMPLLDRLAFWPLAVKPDVNI